MSKVQKKDTQPDQVVVPDKIKPPPAEGWLTSPAKLVPDLWKKNILGNPIMYLKSSINQEYVKQVILDHLVEFPDDPLFVNEMFDELREQARLKKQGESTTVQAVKKEGEPF